MEGLAISPIDVFQIIGLSIANKHYENKIKFYNKKIEKKETKKAEISVKELENEEAKEKANAEVLGVEYPPAPITTKESYELALDKLIENRTEGSDFIRIQLKSAAKRSNTYIDWAIYYMTSDRPIGIIAVDHDAAAFINAISKLFGFGKIYNSEPDDDLRHYDPAYPELYFGDSRVRFFVSIDELEKRITPKFIQKMEKRKTYLNENGMWVNGVSFITQPEPTVNNTNQEIRSPFIIIDDDFKKSEDAKRVTDIDSVLASTIDRIVTPYINNANHYYKQNGDFVDMYILKSTPNALVPLYDKITLDPNGIFIGGGAMYAFIKDFATNNMTGEADQLPVPIVDEFKDILAREFDNSLSTVMTPDEVDRVLHSKYYLNNSLPYYWIDMSNVSFINLNDKEREELTNKLVVLQGMIEHANYLVDGQLPRFRFGNFTDSKNFILISDKNVKSPLVETGETSPAIYEGLLAVCDHDQLYVKFNDQFVAA